MKKGCEIDLSKMNTARNAVVYRMKYKADLIDAEDADKWAAIGGAIGGVLAIVGCLIALYECYKRNLAQNQVDVH